MFQYHCLNPIAEKGLKLFGDNYKKTETADKDVYKRQHRRWF